MLYGQHLHFTLSAIPILRFADFIHVVPCGYACIPICRPCLHNGLICRPCPCGIEIFVSMHSRGRVLEVFLRVSICNGHMNVNHHSCSYDSIFSPQPYLL